MPVEGWRPVTLKEAIMQRLEAQFRLQKEELAMKHITDLGSYISKILEDELERKETLSKYAPFMAEVGIYQNRILIDDKNKDTFFEVIYKDKELFCKGCERNDCMHVGFAYSIPKVIKSLREKKT